MSTTLHLRPGDDLRERLPRAGIAGDHLCFADPVFHLTDLILREVLRRLCGGPNPLLACTAGPTRHGLAVLEGRQRHRPLPRAQGGIAVRPEPPWLWDPEGGRVVAGRG